MRQWLFRLFAFCIGAGMTYVLWVLLMIAALVVGGGPLFCEGADDSCDSQAVNPLGIGKWQEVLIWSSCLASGVVLTVRSWRR